MLLDIDDPAAVCTMCGAETGEPADAWLPGEAALCAACEADAPDEPALYLGNAVEARRAR